MRKTLYKHQQEAVNAAMLSVKEGHVPYLSVSTGGGKSLILAHFIDKAIKQGIRVLTLVPSKELCKQNYIEAHEYVSSPVDIGICCSKLNKFQVHKQSVIATYTSFLRRRATSGKFDVLLIDECFSGDTLISTPQGEKRIDVVRCGDNVYNAIGIGKVEAISIKPTIETYILEFDDESRIECTSEHPFFTKSGWKKTRELEQGEIFFSIKGMSMLWDCFQSESEKGLNGENYSYLSREHVEQASILLSYLSSEIKEPNEYNGEQGKNEEKVKRDKAYAYKTWGERAIASFTSAGASSCSWGWVGIGSISEDEQRSLERYLSELLQDRHSKQGIDDRNRAGRREPLLDREKRERFEKIRASCFPRLVNISINKRESATPVFNISVSGHPSYFANGKLVHNCHLVGYDPKSSFRKIITSLKRINPDLKIIGVTATPVRMLSGRLEEKYLDFDPVFSKCAYETSVQDLIKQGILSHVESISGDIQVDLTDVPIKGGDYDTEIASVRFDTILPHAIPDLKLKIAAYGIKTVLVFASNVANARKIISEWGDDNIRLIYGEMSAVERVHIINWLKHGDGVRVVVNVNVLLIGFNFQKLDAVCFLRATKSLALYRQAVGRVLRSHEEKTVGFVIDYSGNIEEHGPIDCEIPVKGRKRRAEAPRKICTAIVEETTEFEGLTYRKGDECGYPNILSAKKCKVCSAEFVSESEDGRYVMRTRAQILQEKLDNATEVLDVASVQYELAYSSQDGTKMIKMLIYGADFELLHTHNILLNHKGMAKDIAKRLILRMFIDPKNFYKLGEVGVSVDNIIKLLQEHPHYFKTVDKITLAPAVGSRFKDLKSVAFK